MRAIPAARRSAPEIKNLPIESRARTKKSEKTPDAFYREFFRSTWIFFRQQLV
jgi:hypothetical protein